MALAASSVPTRLTRVSRPRRLNIGSGRAPFSKEDGWENCDLHPWEGVDHAFDAQKRWPFPDNSIAEVSSDHVLEHIADYHAFFREAWRVLIPNGQLNLRIPYGWHQSCWWDLTHLRPWLQESFAALQPGFVKFTRNNQHEDLGFAFWVTNCTLILDMPFARMWRFPFLRPLCRLAGKHLLNVYRELAVNIVKTTKDDPTSVAFGGHRHPSAIPCSYGVLKHEYYGQSGKGLEYHEILVFSGHRNEIAGNG